MNIERLIDHTLLRSDATRSEIHTLCMEARQYGFASVCVNPVWVSTCAELLKNSAVGVCSVIGFPLGATTTTIKVVEADEAVNNGATELDMVINLGVFKSGDHLQAGLDIQAVVERAEDQALVKVILECGFLSNEEIVKASDLARQAGARFVKTSTGFGPRGATVEDVTLMYKAVGNELGVKASGGISDLATAKAMLAAGASRIGTSSSVAIVTAMGSKGGHG